MTSIMFRAASVIARSRLGAGSVQSLMFQWKRNLAVFPKGVDLLSDPESLKCAVKRYGAKAFLINNWRVRRIEDMTIDDLSVFKLLYPGLQILLIGCGSNAWTDRQRKQEFIDHFIKFGITLEFLSSRQAASTFTILNSEERKVAAAIVTLEAFTEEEESEVFREYRSHLPSTSSASNALPETTPPQSKEEMGEEAPPIRK